jgi:hypothetical protein
MVKHVPPVPPANRPKNGPQTDAGHTNAEEARVTQTDPRLRNLEQQGRQGNIAQNTRNQGYQQDR